MDFLRHSYLYHPLQPYGLPVQFGHPYNMLPSPRCTCECYCMQGNQRSTSACMMQGKPATAPVGRYISEGADGKLMEASESDIFSTDKSGRRNRTTYKRWQIDELERAFVMNPYPTSIFKKTLAMRLGLRDSRVQVWFQNRRAKSKREKRSTADSFSNHESLDNADFRSVDHTLLYNKVLSQEVQEDREVTKSRSD